MSKLDKIENFFTNIEERKFNRDKLIWVIALLIILCILLGVYFLK